MAEIKLYPFQLEAVEKLRGHIREGKKTMILSCPTGGGKTECGLHLLAEAHAKGKRACFVVDRLSLLDQTSARADLYGIPHGVIQSDHARTRPWERIQIASIQTILRRGWPEADLLIVDECHSVHREVVKRLAERNVVAVGLSATAFTKGLGRYYQAVVSAVTTQKLIDDGYLAPYRIFAPTQPDMTGAPTVAGEWADNVAGERAAAIVGDVVLEYQRHCPDEKAICFCANIAHGEELRRQFLASGIVAELYTYQTGDDERARLLEEYRKPDSYVRVLISVAALARGFDVPDVTCVMLCRPLRKSLAEHIQTMGRGLRRDPANPDKVCTILDLAGNTVRFWHKTNEFFLNGLTALDDGKPKAEQIVTEAEVIPHKCPKCSHVHAPRPTCPTCGFEYPKRRIIHAAGELVAVGHALEPAAKRDQFLRELLGIAVARGYARGWAAVTYKERYSAWPTLPWRTTEPLPPSPGTLKFVQNRQVASARARARTRKQEQTV